MLRRRREQQQARAAGIDARRWAQVIDLLEPGEVQLYNTPAMFFERDGSEWEGVCFLTERALIGDVGAGVMPYRWRLELAGLDEYQVREYRLGVRAGEDFHVMELYPSPLSVQLTSELVAQMKALHA